MNHKEYYKGEGGGFSQVRVVVSFVSLCMWRVPKLLGTHKCEFKEKTTKKQGIGGHAP